MDVENGELAPEPNYYDKYKDLKKKLHFLLYENQSYQDELRQAQKKLLQVTRDKNFLLERLMKYEGVSSDSDSDTEEKNVDDKTRQGFSPAPPSFKRPNVIAVTPSQTPTSLTMPSPRGLMQSPSYGSPKTNQSPTLPSPSAVVPSPAPNTSPKSSPRSRKASSNDTVNKTTIRKPPYPPPEIAKQVTKFPNSEDNTMFCTHVENGAQCNAEISRKSKTKLCGTHRRLLNKKKKQQSNANEEMANSPAPTPSSNVASSPIPQSPHPMEGNMLHPGMMQPTHRHSMGYRGSAPGGQVPPNFSGMYPQGPSVQMQIQLQQQYQLQMKRMMLQQSGNKEYYNNPPYHHYQIPDQQFQQQQQQQQQQQSKQSTQNMNQGRSQHGDSKVTTSQSQAPELTIPQQMPPVPVSQSNKKLQSSQQSKGPSNKEASQMARQQQQQQQQQQIHFQQQQQQQQYAIQQQLSQQQQLTQQQQMAQLHHQRMLQMSQKQNALLQQHQMIQQPHYKQQNPQNVDMGSMPAVSVSSQHTKHIPSKAYQKSPLSNMPTSKADKRSEMDSKPPVPQIQTAPQPQPAPQIPPQSQITAQLAPHTVVMNPHPPRPELLSPSSKQKFDDKKDAISDDVPPELVAALNDSLEDNEMK